MEQWYTLHTKPQAEYMVAVTMQQRHIETYLPEIKTLTRQKKWVAKPFFPGYLFARVDLKITGLAVVQWTPGLYRILAFDNQPVSVPETVIELIRAKLAEDGRRRDRFGCPFATGDTVRITEGPFKEMLAIFDRPTTGLERVQVLLNILGHTSRVQLAVTDLEKAGHSTPPLLKRPRRTRGGGRRIEKTGR